VADAQPVPEPRSVVPSRIPRSGRKPGDRRVHVRRPEARYFRYGEQGTIVAKAAAIEPASRVGRLGFGARRLLFGRVLSTHEELEQRLPKWKALAVFSSDVMSSVAYATEASMFTLLAVGTVAFSYLLPISFLIVGLLFLVTFSYRQTIRAYPQGGGSYIVARANLGVLPGLVAAAALLTDYVLTVSVSVASGVFNLASAFPVLGAWLVPIDVACILLVMGVNLRGIKESGTVFALPTYIFISSVLLLVGLGIFQTVTGHAPQVTGVAAIKVPVESLSVLLLMRAFADGCSAMTGTEAISNGTPAFKPPEWKNAQTTMVTMAAILGVVFLGISYLATVSGAVPSQAESVLSQIGRAVFGSTPIYYVLIFSTMGILVLAAQTSFADFPRLASILARDGFMPRQFAFRGERLAFNSGIVALAIIAIIVVATFNGRVEALIPLYAIGVFTAFTLSQSGMVRHWLASREPGWQRSAVINACGAVATGIVGVIFAIAKFALGAWIVIIIVPILVVLMLLVAREYRAAQVELHVRPEAIIGPPSRGQRVIVPVQDMRRDAIQAIKLGLTMSKSVVAVHVTDDLAAAEAFRSRFDDQVHGVDLVIVESPYREFVRPLIRYLELTAAKDPSVVTIVLIPERIIRHWWERLLYNQSAYRLRDALTGHPGILVADVPFRRPR
jgi:amino acid transporter